MAENLEDRFIEIRGLSIHYLEAGSKEPPVIFLHGGSGSAYSCWQKNIEPISHERKIFALDLPGYGGSDKPKIQYTTDFYVNILNDFLDKLGIEKCGLVGISMGGGISLSFSLKHPEKVGKLVLVDSHGLGKKIPFFHRLNYFLIQLPYLDEILWKFFQIVEGRYLKWAFISWLREEVQREGFRSNFVNDLPLLEVPTLIIHGEKDKIVPLSWAKRANKLIKNSKIHIFPKCSHWPQGCSP